jgi:hypothetical protein
MSDVNVKSSPIARLPKPFSAGAIKLPAADGCASRNAQTVVKVSQVTAIVP